MDAFDQFKEEWAKLPPLARACLASELACKMSNQLYTERDHNRTQRFLGMERRAEVGDRISDGVAAVGTLFVNLANEADKEAVARGIDADTEEG